jgi:site-specific recombinase XerC
MPWNFGAKIGPKRPLAIDRKLRGCDLVELKIEDFVFLSRVDASQHLSLRQYAHLVDEWVEAIGLLPAEYRTRSLCRTEASIIYKATGNIRAIQIFLGHSRIESTVRYLSAVIEDAFTLAGKAEI